MNLRKLVLSRWFVLFVSLVYAAVMAPFTPRFLSLDNAASVFSSMLPLLIVAVGQTVVLITGGIDLSVTSTIALASVTGAMVMTGFADNAFAGALAMILAGALVGLLNGAAITGARMPPFMVTLSTMMFFGGLAVWVTKSKNIGGLPAGFRLLGDSIWIVFAMAVIVLALTYILLERTVAGRWLFAAGRNVRTAVASGVPVKRTLVLAYVLCGVCAAVASIIYTGRLETGSPVLGQRILLDVIAAVVIGGTSLFGGRGNVLWTALGVLFITLVDNTLNLLGATNFAVLMAKGGVILVAAMLDSMRTRYGHA
ncbi:MAG TPA: ABC transporter permease [Bryobacteraceae bacterium]|nr:ABC transporter permease [Bryobacteraceae bacterium]